ncbi:hypothetical protein OTB20_20880 [Streptomyces sp. H27-H1]|uniref:hypothetical protein n=1 Tax=Streptomyces sp. H27-H1 TaxID=2996461 RepID=UPI002271F079|nr:hypothetical protein [Streptomyces sp. H27-H1]MCY0928613.1 hypothetical protein [Streptomyces sp. H27-H1]
MSALLRLYPAVYRREFGDEIADSYREATAGAGRPARLREAVDVVGHALRMRLGLGSAGRAGRLLAALAPFAVVALAVNAMTWARLSVTALRMDRQIDGIGPSVLMGAAGLAMLLGAVLALTGRWAVGVWTVLAGTAAIFTSQVLRLGLGLEFAVVTSGPLLLLALVAVLCPPDLRSTRSLRAAGVSAVGVATVLLTIAPQMWTLPYPLGALYVAGPVAGGLMLAGRPAFARLSTAPEVLLAGLPFVVLGAFSGLLDLLFLPALGLLLAASTTVAVRRRRGRSKPSA